MIVMTVVLMSLVVLLDVLIVYMRCYIAKS